MCQRIQNFCAQSKLCNLLNLDHTGIWERASIVEAMSLDGIGLGEVFRYTGRDKS